MRPLVNYQCVLVLICYKQPFKHAVRNPYKREKRVSANDKYLGFLVTEDAFHLLPGC